jgi:hypothetical protein
MVQKLFLNFIVFVGLQIIISILWPLLILLLFVTSFEEVGEQNYVSGTIVPFLSSVHPLFCGEYFYQLFNVTETPQLRTLFFMSHILISSFGLSLVFMTLDLIKQKISLKKLK